MENQEIEQARSITEVQRIFESATAAAKTGHFDVAVQKVATRFLHLESTNEREIRDLRHEANKAIITELCEKLGTYVVGFLGPDLAPEQDTSQ